MKDGGPAFPTTRIDRDGDEHIVQGISIRDYFAAKAMQAMVSSCRDIERDQGPVRRSDGSLIDFVRPCLIDEDDVAEQIGKGVALSSYIIADAMLKAREGGA